ncbi:hypothetical protein H5410_050174, partial [Solanum commersonii]
MEISPSPLSRNIVSNQIPYKANFKRISRESSGDLGNARRLRLSGEAFGDRSERKRSGTVSWSTRDRLSGRLWFSLVRLSMFRHLFIDLLEYGGFRVSSMLNFYNSCLRPYFRKVLGYDSMSLDIIEYPYLV